MTVTNTQGLGLASSGLDRVLDAAKRDKDLRFTNLLHHIDIERLHGATGHRTIMRLSELMV